MVFKKSIVRARAESKVEKGSGTNDYAFSESDSGFGGICYNLRLEIRECMIL